MRSVRVMAPPLLAVIAALLCSVPAGASPWNPGCGTAQYGTILGRGEWEEHGPYHIGMSYKTARSIARRVGPDEFAPPNSHPNPREIPCTVVGSIAYHGGDARLKWPGDSGWMGAGWMGYNTDPYFGAFH